MVLIARLYESADGDLEKLAFLRQKSGYEKFAEYLRKRTSTRWNPYAVATRPIQTASKRLFRGGAGAAAARAVKLGIGGLFVSEFLTGVGDNMKANRAAMQQWGV